MKIIITGSLGHISRPLTQDLVQKRHQVTVISSRTQRRKDIWAIGASAAIGSLLDKNFLLETFSGADAVYCMVPPDMVQPDQTGYYERIGSAYEQAIRQTGVSRVVHLSSYGAHLETGTGFIAGSNRVERLLNPIPNLLLTHIRPTSFYYNLFSYMAMIKAAAFMGDIYGGNDRLVMASPQDIAEAVSKEIVKTENIDRVVYVNSDERKCNEVAAVLGAAIGIPDMKWEVLTKEDVLNTLANTHIPEHTAAMLVELGEAIHSGRLREDFDSHIPLSGKVKLEDFAQEFARVFHQH